MLEFIVGDCSSCFLCESRIGIFVGKWLVDGFDSAYTFKEITKDGAWR